METIGKVASTANLPPVEVVNDKSCFKLLHTNGWINVLKSKVELLETYVDSLSSENRIQHSEKDLAEFLIFCGENSIIAEWNDASVVTKINRLLLQTISLLGFKGPEEILRVGEVSSIVIKDLKSKVQKEVLKKFPASVNCFFWVTKYLKSDDLENLAPNILPVCLVLLDDWEPSYQEKGLQCIYHILKENPKQLQHSGWNSVLYSNLKKNPQIEDKFCLYECLDMCLKNQLPSRLDPVEWNKINEYDHLLSYHLDYMVMGESLNKLRTNLKILLLLINSMQVRIAAHIRPILDTLERNINDSIPEELYFSMCSVIERIIRYCWPCCEESICSQLIWMLFKLNSLKRMPKEPLCETKKLLEIILRKVSPELCDVLNSEIICK